MVMTLDTLQTSLYVAYAISAVTLIYSIYMLWLNKKQSNATPVLKRIEVLLININNKLDKFKEVKKGMEKERIELVKEEKKKGMGGW